MAYYGGAGGNYAAGDNYGRAGNYPYAAGGLPLIGAGLSFLAKKLLPKAVQLFSRPAVVAGTAVATTVGIKRAVAPPPPGMLPVPGIGGALERALPFGETGFYRKRRMNVANVKALRRALRRQTGFIKLARRALKGTGMTIRRGGAGGGGSRGVITRSEAAKALRR